MTVTVNTKAFAFDTNTTPDTGRHNGPSQNFQSRDYLDLKRTAPKPKGDFLGVARSSAKFARTVTLAQGGTAELIGEAFFSVPVGTSKADVDSIRDDLGDFLVSTNGDDLVYKHDINQ